MAGLAALAYALVLVAASRIGVAAFSVSGQRWGAPAIRGNLSIPRGAQRGRAVRMALASGDALGDFSLTNQEGETVSLDSIKGQRTLFWMYSKADTGG